MLLVGRNLVRCAVLHRWDVYRGVIVTQRPSNVYSNAYHSIVRPLPLSRMYESRKSRDPKCSQSAVKLFAAWHSNSTSPDKRSDVKEAQIESVEKYIGVVYNSQNIKKYSAELELDDKHTVCGGDFWTAIDAARAYDEMLDLYCDEDAPRNFARGDAKVDQTTNALAQDEWAAPDHGKRHAEIIPCVPGKYFTLDEVVRALEREKGMEIYAINLEGKSKLAKYMVFVTGRSQTHMRRMADMIIQSIKARKIKDDFDYGVEGRDCDDWMIADCNTIIVHFLMEDTRRILKLEEHWEQMENDCHKIYGHMTEEEYMAIHGTSELMDYYSKEEIVTTEKAFMEEEEARHLNEKRLLKGDDVEWR